MNSDEKEDKASDRVINNIADEIEARVKGDVIYEVKESLGRSLGGIMDSLEKISSESWAKQDLIIRALNERFDYREAEIASLAQDIELLEESVKRVVEEKDEALDRIESALARVAELEKELIDANELNKILERRLNSYWELLNEAVTLAESIFREKTLIEKELTRLREKGAEVDDQ